MMAAAGSVQLFAECGYVSVLVLFARRRNESNPACDYRHVNPYYVRTRLFCNGETHRPPRWYHSVTETRCSKVIFPIPKKKRLKIRLYRRYREHGEICLFSKEYLFTLLNAAELELSRA